MGRGHFFSRRRSRARPGIVGIMPTPRYRLLDHTADMAFEVEAPDWTGLLVAATEALSDVVRAVDADRDAEPLTWARRSLEARGADREDVLVAWLGEVLWLFDGESVLVRHVDSIEADDVHARGAVRGIVVDPERAPPDRIVKAVTYHDLVVEEGGEGRPWRATVVLDL
jgi:SHS2 domain-containing protein